MKRTGLIFLFVLVFSLLAGHVFADTIDVTPTYLPDGTVGAPYSAQLAASGGTAPYAFSATGLPSGLSISTGGLVSGIPSQAIDLTNTGFTVTVSDSAGNGVSKGLGIKIVAAPPIDVSTTYLPDGTVGFHYSSQVSVSGGVPPYSFGAEGLPSGLSISTGGLVSGTPTQAIDLTNTGFTVSVTDRAGNGMYKGLGIKINPTPQFNVSTTYLPDGTVGVPYSAQVSVSGGVPPYAFSATGLPAGLSISSDGVVSGTPTTPIDLTNTGFTVTVSDSFGNGMSKGIGIRINSVQNDTAPPVVSTSVSGNGNIYTITATATDASGISGIGIYLAQGTQSAHGYYSIVASCASSPCTYTSGDNDGTYVYFATVSDASANRNSANSEEKTFTLPFASSGLSIATNSLPNYYMGCTYQSFITASGGSAPYAWSATGVPAFLTFGAGTLATTTILSNGNPPTAGTVPMQFQVSSNGAMASKQLSLTVVPVATISTSSLPDGVVGTAYSTQALISNGVGTPEWYADGLPNGLSIARTTGVISGTPAQAGTFSVTLREYDGCVDLTRTLQLTVRNSGDIYPPSLAAFVSGSGNTYTIVVYTSDNSDISIVNIYLASGTLSSHGSYSVVKTCPGEPCNYTNTGTSGSYVYYVSSTDASVNHNIATTDPAQFTLPFGAVTIDVQPTYLPNGTVGVPYSTQLVASGGTPPYAFSATGLPAGLSISASGLVSGTPTQAIDLTNTGFTVTVTDQSGNGVSKGLGIKINPAVPVNMDILPTYLPNGTVGVPYSAQLTASGGTPPYNFSATGIPAGLAISASGLVFGTPTTGSTPMNNGLTVTANDSAGHGLTKGIGLYINYASIDVTPTYLPDGTVGVPYSAQLTAVGGTAPYAFSATGLPAGLSISASGRVSGTPTTAVDLTNTGFTVTVTDAYGNGVSKGLGIKINQAAAAGLDISPASIPDGAVNASYSVQLSASGGVSPYVFSATGLPNGLAISSNGVISGTPLQNGTFATVVRVTDFAGNGTTRQYSLKINPVGGDGGNGGNGGNGGSSSGGGSGGSSGGASSIAASSPNTICTGQKMEIRARATSGSGKPVVEAIFKSPDGNSRVFYEVVSQGGSAFFTPDKAGTYELRISLGTDQRTTDFVVSACGLPSAPANSAPTPTIELSGQSSLVFSKTVTYAGGFTKEFRTYSLGTGGYYTDIILSYTNTGAAMPGVSVADSVPREVLSSPDRITFQLSPSTTSAQPMPSFTWAASIPAGGKVSYAYRIGRQVTDDMIGRFAAPSILAGSQPAGTSGGQSYGNLLAASIGVAGLSLPLSTVAIAVGGLVLAGLAVLFVFGRKQK